MSGYRNHSFTSHKLDLRGIIKARLIKTLSFINTQLFYSLCCFKANILYKVVGLMVFFCFPFPNLRCAVLERFSLLFSRNKLLLPRLSERYWIKIFFHFSRWFCVVYQGHQYYQLRRKNQESSWFCIYIGTK